MEEYSLNGISLPSEKDCKEKRRSYLNSLYGNINDNNLKIKKCLEYLKINPTQIDIPAINELKTLSGLENLCLMRIEYKASIESGEEEFIA